MDDTADTAQVVIRPPLAWALAIIAGLALNWLVPLPFLPADLPAGWLGAMVFVFALVLFAWAIVTISRTGWCKVGNALGHGVKSSLRSAHDPRAGISGR
jgi:hypothetical protein